MTISNTDLNPIYMINDYVWNLLKQEMGLTKIDNMNPITTADGPEFRESNKPYLIYSYNEEASPELRSRHMYNAAYAVFDTSTKHGGDIINLISRALNDEEAPNNILSWANNPSNPMKNTFAGINLGSISVAGSESPDPAVDEGGMVSGFILFRYSFTAPDHNYSITG